jgi:hypothetical protein
MHIDDGFVFTLFLFGLGVFGFFWGFRCLQKKRLIENIPTSTVRGLAMGMVELCGRAKEKTPLASPFTQSACVFYKYTIEEYRRSKNSSRWVRIAKGDSATVPFILEDDTGSVTVFPQGAETIVPADYSKVFSSCNALPVHIIGFLEKTRVRYKGLFGFSKRLRFKEWYITMGEVLYVLGHAQKAREYVKGHTENLKKRLDQLRADEKAFQAIDTDGDGTVSAEGWDAAVKKIEADLITEELARGGAGRDLDDVVIARGEHDTVFIISDHKETKLVQTLHWKAILGIFGGAALTLGSLFVLLKYCGLF